MGVRSAFAREEVDNDNDVKLMRTKIPLETVAEYNLGRDPQRLAVTVTRFLAQKTPAVDKTHHQGPNHEIHGCAPREKSCWSASLHVHTSS